ncbi:MAG: thiamine phosphate synthase [Candidatus Binatia bacterium]
MIAGLPASRLCLVTDRRRLAEACGLPLDQAIAALHALAAAAGECGIGAIQLRERDLTARQLFTLASELRDRLPSSTRLLVNDRADIAAALAVGVHLRESSMPTSRVRSACPAATPIWRAVHDRAGVDGAGPVDALVAGTVAPTPSKPAAAVTLGLDGLRDLVAATAVPVYAIGGLKGSDWPGLAARGVHGVAAIGVFLPRRGETIAGAVSRAVAAFATSVD